MTGLSSERTPAAPASSPELSVLFQQLQQSTFVAALGGVFVLGVAGGLVLPGAESFIRQLFLSLSLFGIGLLAWMLYRWRQIAGIVTLVAGAFLAIGLAMFWVGTVWAFCLCALPCGLVMLMLSRRLGIACAAALTAISVVAPIAVLPVPGDLRALTVTLLWCTLGLIWLTLRPVLSTAEWAWETYEQGQQVLQRMGDTQAELKQALADAQHANVQLTRMNRLADGLRQAAEDARRIKEQFVANVSHELRTPLNMIIGFSEIIVNQPQTYGERVPPALLADLDIILRNSRHLSSLIDDVLDLSQIEANQMALTKERVRIADVIIAATTAVRGLFASKGLYLRTELPDDLPDVFCDNTRIREVVLNLLSNAGRFTERGGAVVRVVRKDADVLISVSDTGPGIASADADKLFQPFQQVDGSVRRRYGGSGLGLAISKNFVELHDGRMWLESTPGAGTTFFFTLPIKPHAPIAAGAARWLTDDWTLDSRMRGSHAPAPVVKARLVICEPHDVLERLLRRYMANTEVVGVRSMEELLRELAEAPANAVLLNNDAVVGATWVQRLTADKRLPADVPVFVCHVPGPPDASSLLGATGYLVKPVARETLLAALDQVRLGAAAAQPRTILIVDDEPDALRLFWRALTGLGRDYRVLTAGNGLQAIEILRNQRPDVVFMDLVMPEADGFWLLNEKNRDPALRDIPMFVISARDPNGQPIVSDALSVTRAGGLSLPQLLACLASAIGILSPMRPSTDPASPATQPA
jgi:signal transduction histidine kinase/CheY-like chemotaxis protein